jgi:hypothetical protein
MADSSNLQAASNTLRERVEEVLSENGIYKVGHHGWIGPDDIDPEEIGHAMAQLDDPADAVLTREWYSKDPVILEKWKALCSVAGADFEGLMNGTRLSIGYALVQINDLKESLEDEDSLAAMYSRSAYMTLGAASDRIRDYLVWGIFRSARQDRWYTKAFEAVPELEIENESIRARFPALIQMAQEVYELRRKRNFLVHQIATEAGRIRKAAIESAARGANFGNVWEELTEADFYHLQQQDEQQRLARIEEAVGTPIAWYKLLVRLSESVFFIENRFRASA